MFYMYTIYSKASLTNHLLRSPTPLDRSLYLYPKRSIEMIFYLPKTTTSVNGPFEVDPKDGRFREVLLYTHCIYVHLKVSYNSCT